jgi:hypothetical protein
MPNKKLNQTFCISSNTNNQSLLGDNSLTLAEKINKNKYITTTDQQEMERLERQQELKKNGGKLYETFWSDFNDSI